MAGLLTEVGDAGLLLAAGGGGGGGELDVGDISIVAGHLLIFPVLLLVVRVGTTGTLSGL